jgi:molybdate transport system ATP-binding protein
VDDHLEVELGHRVSRLELDVGLRVGVETLALVGPSGSGKSTILRAVAGLLRPQRGRITHAGRVLLDTSRGIDVPPEERRVGMVYQDGALFPFLSVLRNVAYGARGPRREHERQARTVLERFGIERLADAHPGDLSGGERQRVALARAVASDPRILLLDEPLSALDAVTKAEVAAELESRLRQVGVPAILVSHDFADVLGLADRVSVLQEGRIVQTGEPSELVEAPASAFVASLAGVNYFAGTADRRGELTEVRADGWERPLVSTDVGRGPVGLVVYPWEVALSLVAPHGSALNAVSGFVRRVVPAGNRIRVTVDGPPTVVAEVTEESVRHLALAPGAVVVATWKATATRLVGRSSPAGLRLSYPLGPGSSASST